MVSGSEAFRRMDAKDTAVRKGRFEDAISAAVGGCSKTDIAPPEVNRGSHSAMVLLRWLARGPMGPNKTEEQKPGSRDPTGIDRFDPSLTSNDA